jgi:hypothetical protein
VVDRHLPDVPRERVRQLPAGVRDPEEGVGERSPVVRAPVVGGEDGRQAADDGGEALGRPIDTTATTGLPTAVTALMSSTCCAGRSMSAVSPPSDSVRSSPYQPALPPTARMTTSACRAAATAAGMSVGWDGTTPVPATAVTWPVGRSRRTASARDTAGYEDLTYSSRSPLAPCISALRASKLSSGTPLGSSPGIRNLRRLAAIRTMLRPAG